MISLQDVHLSGVYKSKMLETNHEKRTEKIKKSTHPNSYQKG